MTTPTTIARRAVYGWLRGTDTRSAGMRAMAIIFGITAIGEAPRRSTRLDASSVCDGYPIGAFPHSIGEGNQVFLIGIRG